MSIASEITRLQTAKASLKTSIEAKGVAVPSATTLDGYASLVNSIPTGTQMVDGLLIREVLWTTSAPIEPRFLFVKATLYTGSGMIPSGICYGQTKVTELLFHDPLQNVIRIGEHAFDYCSAPVGTYPSSWANVTNLGGYSFANCKGLNGLHLSFPSLRIASSYAFQNSGLAGITVSSTSYTEIGSVFYGCSSLAIADFRAPTKINSYAFYNCTSLNTLILRTPSVVSVGATNYFQNSPIATGTGTVYVPSSLINSYRTATTWSTFYSAGTRFLAIETSQYASKYADGTDV